MPPNFTDLGQWSLGSTVGSIWGHKSHHPNVEVGYIAAAAENLINRNPVVWGKLVQGMVWPVCCKVSTH